MVLTEITNRVLNSGKENMTLLKALAQSNKEIQNLRINNQELARAHGRMLALYNTNRARLKELQHEVGCKNAFKKQLEKHVQIEEQDQVQQNEKRRIRRPIELNTTDFEISSKGSSSNARNGEDVTEQITSSAQGKKDDCSSKDLYNSAGENMPLIEETEEPEEVGASEDGERVPTENHCVEDDRSLMSEAVEPSDSRYTTKETNQNRRDISFFKNGERRKILWTVEEEAMLKAGVEKFAPEANKNIPWSKILKMGEEVFHKTRKPADLKDKWRRLVAGFTRIA